MNKLWPKDDPCAADRLRTTAPSAPAALHANAEQVPPAAQPPVLGGNIRVCDLMCVTVQLVSQWVNNVCVI